MTQGLVSLPSLNICLQPHLKADSPDRYKKLSAVLEGRSTSGGFFLPSQQKDAPFLAESLSFTLVGPP